jgi:hypothetical protein
MEGRKGETSKELKVYDLDERRVIDAEVTRRTIDFMKRSTAAGKPFYAYVCMTQVHVPVLPHPDSPTRWPRWTTGWANCSTPWTS